MKRRDGFSLVLVLVRRLACSWRPLPTACEMEFSQFTHRAAAWADQREGNTSQMELVAAGAPSAFGGGAQELYFSVRIPTRWHGYRRRKRGEDEMDESVPARAR